MSFTSEPIAALHALAHPTRLRILEHLHLANDATASECAAAVGDTASSCSYHLRTLARHGFVEEVPSDDGRERRWRRAVDTIDWDAGADRDEEFQAASALARAAMLQLSDERVRDYVAHEREFAGAWREAAAFLQTTLIATPAELEAVVARIVDALGDFRADLRDDPPADARVVHVSVRAVPKP